MQILFTLDEKKQFGEGNPRMKLFNKNEHERILEVVSKLGRHSVHHFLARGTLVHLMTLFLRGKPLRLFQISISHPPADSINDTPI